MSVKMECTNCKHFDRDDHEFPCSDCKFTAFSNEPEYKQRDVLWQPMTNDAVNHPGHYNQGKYECIDVMVDNFGKQAVEHFCLLNAFKYVWRSNYKNGIEDIKKAWWYLDKYLELEGEKHD